jgi:hypothetical protein
MSNYNNSYSTIPMAEARGLRAVKPSVILCQVEKALKTYSILTVIMMRKRISRPPRRKKSCHVALLRILTLFLMTV